MRESCKKKFHINNRTDDQDCDDTKNGFLDMCSPLQAAILFTENITLNDTNHESIFTGNNGLWLIRLCIFLSEKILLLELHSVNSCIYSPVHVHKAAPLAHWYKNSLEQFHLAGEYKVQ